MKEVRSSGRFVMVGDMRFEVPASVAHLCEPAGQLRSIHGLGESDVCACGELASMSAGGVCPGCSRPYQHRCTSCEGWVQPGPKLGGRWYSPPSQCATCEADRAEKARRSRLGGIPAEIREAASAYRKRLPHRKVSDGSLSQWLDDDCGRVLGSKLCVWLSGVHGCGKSVSAARAAAHAVTTGMVSSFLWTTSREVIECSKMRFIEGGGAYRALLDRARDAELVVFDEMWRNGRGPVDRLMGVEGATQNGLMVLSDILRSRVDHRLPTVFTSKYPVISVRQLLGDATWHRMAASLEGLPIEDVDMRNA